MFHRSTLLWNELHIGTQCGKYADEQYTNSCILRARSVNRIQCIPMCCARCRWSLRRSALRFSSIPRKHPANQSGTHAKLHKTTSTITLFGSYPANKKNRAVYARSTGVLLYLELKRGLLEWCFLKGYHPLQIFDFFISRSDLNFDGRKQILHFIS